EADIAVFSNSSGLSGSISDWLVVGSLQTTSGIELIARTLLKDAGDVKKTEGRFLWQNLAHEIAATYVGLSADLKEDRPKSLSSLNFNWKYRFAPNWRSSSEFQLDSSIGKLSQLNMGIRYENECVNIDFSASRRLSTSATLNDKTEFSLSVELLGFSSGVGKIRNKEQCGTSSNEVQNG
ncbi:MAG: hypothetical protein OSB34_16630, partial [Planktomarina sp.]|nr:hypothetical protein [Planktomarina sp.]